MIYWSVISLCAIFQINLLVFIFLHFNQLRMGCTDCITNSNEQAVFIQWTFTFDNDLLDSKEVQQLHLQELRLGQLKGILGHLWKLARNGSCVWDHMVGLHMVIWNVVHVKNFILIYHVLSPSCKSLQKLYICDHEKSNDHKSAVMARWESLHFLQLVWFMLLVMHVQANVDSLNKGSLFNTSKICFNASNILSPKYYSSDEEAYIIMSHQLLERLIM